MCDVHDRLSMMLIPRNLKLFYLLHLSSTHVNRGECLCLLFFYKINDQLFGFADSEQKAVHHSATIVDFNPI